MKTVSLILLCLLLNACAFDPSADIDPIQKIDNIQDLSYAINTPFIGSPTPDNYSICHGHTCNKFASISLSDRQWQTVVELFEPVAGNAQQEREQIKLAIALLERLTGEQAGTHRDRAKNYIKQGLNGQLDCIDEATNSTVYYTMLVCCNSTNKHLEPRMVV